MRTSIFDITRQDDTLTIVTFNKSLANRLNKLTNHYGDYTIQEGEEPIFTLPISDLELFLEILPKNMDKAYIRTLFPISPNQI